jgi:hypothetical protein
MGGRFEEQATRRSYWVHHYCNKSAESLLLFQPNAHNMLNTYTGRFIMFSMITNIYNKETKGPTLMELFTATGKLKKFFYN